MTGPNPVKCLRAQIALLLAAATLISVAGASFLRSFDWSASPWEGVACHVAIRDGNVRIIRMTAVSVASHIGVSPLERHIAQQRQVPTKAFQWDSETRTLSDTTRVYDTIIGLTLFAPAYLAIFASVVLVPLVRRPSHGRLLIGELWRPSNRRTIGRRILGWCRRGAMAVLVFVAGLFAIVWAQSHGLLSGLSIRQYAVGPLRIKSWGPIVSISGSEELVDPFVVLRTEQGIINLAGYVRVPKAWPQPDHSLHWSAFRWRVSGPFTVRCGLGLPQFTQEQLAYFGRTNPVRISASAPLWAPTALFSAWPLWAFFRGPWRRSGRRADGICLQCGYDLTGLTEPRCPECGTPFEPSDQLDPIEQPAAMRKVCHG